MAIYKGFTTVNRDNAPFTATDIELVKVDLMNTFNTTLGERVMLPSFGSIIQQLIMDPLDVIATDRLMSNIRGIVDADPRVELQDEPVLTPLDNTVRLELELYFIAQASADHLIIEFDRDVGAST